MDGGTQAGLIVVGFLALGTLYLIGCLIWFAMKTIFLGIPNSMDRVRLESARRYRLPNADKSMPVTNRHRRDDYWNDAGNGSGVNYVVMPNGEVRID